MMSYYSIKKLSELTSVKTITLRYYDNIGLLKPSHKTHSNHRAYTKSDLGKLQKLMTLRYLGFSIEHMKKILSNTFLDLEQSLEMQMIILSEKIQYLLEAERLMANLIHKAKQDGCIDWPTQAKIVETLELQDPNKNNWYKTFLTPTEERAFHVLAKQKPDEYWADYQKRWEILFNDIENNLHTDTDSEIAFSFSTRWFALVNEVYKQNRALGNKLWEGYKAGIISDSALPHNPAVIEYMTEANKKYLTMLNASMQDKIHEPLLEPMTDE